MLSGRSLPGWAAILVGTACVLLAATGLAAVGGGVVWLARSDASRADLALAAMLWLAVAGVAAWAVGGWVAGRTARGRAGGGPRRGAGVGVLAILALPTIGWAVAGDAVDLASAAYALGLADPPGSTGARSAALPERSAAAAGGSTAAAIARARTLDSVGYLAAVGVLLVGASVLGALHGESRSRSVRPAGSPPHALGRAGRAPRR